MSTRLIGASESISPAGDRAGRWRHATPERFYGLAGRLLPWCWSATLLLTVAGMVVALGVAPSDSRQDEVHRVLFVHAPTAWLSAIVYAAMTFWAGLGLWADEPLPSMLASALAPTGALMAFLALWTGALWAKPRLGSWWVWDPRLSAQLLLLALYLAVIVLPAVSDEPRRAIRVGAIVTLAGAAPVPLVYYALWWWNAPAVSPDEGPGEFTESAGTMLAGRLLMTAAVAAWCLASTLHRARSIILERERGAEWTRTLPEAQA